MLDISRRNAAIGSMMEFVGKLSPDKEVQLSLFASALVTCCIEFGVTKENALEALESIFDASNDLVTLERPARGRLN